MQRRPLKEHTNAELLDYLEKNETGDMRELAAICSEILRRMNKQNPLFPKVWDENA